MSYYIVRQGDSPMGIVAKYGLGPEWTQALLASNRHKQIQVVYGIPTFVDLHVGEMLSVPSQMESAAMRARRTPLVAVTHGTLGAAAIAAPQSCDAIDFSKFGNILPQQKQQIIDTCKATQKQISDLVEQYKASGYTQEQADQAAQAYQASKKIISIVDYFQNAPDYASMTHDQIKAQNKKLYDDVGAISAAAIAVINPIVGAAYYAIWTVIENASLWFGDLIGLYDPLSLEVRALFQNPCDPSSPDFGSFWPFGLPPNSSDPRWVDDPTGSRLVHPNQGGTKTLDLASPPGDRSKYRWLSGFNPNGEFEIAAFAILIQNAINQFNCSLFIPDNELLDSFVKVWNQSRDHNDPNMVLRKFDITPPPVRSPGPCNNEDVSGCVPPNEGTVPIDPITQAFRNGHFDWNAYYGDGQTHWNNLGSLYIIDAKPIAPPGGRIKKYTHLYKDEPTSTTTKVVIGTTVVGAVAAASLWYYAYRTGRTFTGAAKHIYDVTKLATKKTFTRRRGVREGNPLALPAGPTSTAIVPYRQSDPEQRSIVPYRQEVVPYQPPHRPSTAIIPRKRSKQVAYRFELGGDPYEETVLMLGDGTAVAYRQTRPIARFTPTKYQLPKIISGHGTLNVYTHQLLR